MSSPIGYFVMNQMTGNRGWSQDETTRFFDHIKALQPTTLLFLDDDGKALQAKALLPDCAVVVRSYLDGDGDLYRNENASPQTVFNWYKNTSQGLIRNILNEPNGYVSDSDVKRLAHWCAEIADLFGDAGIPVVLPNFGEGHPNIDKLDLLEELWTALDKWHDLHYYGCHEYGSHFGMVWNGGDHKFDMYPWRVGRFEAFVKPYLETHGHKIPNVILTEFGCDSAHDNTNYRGWRTCWDDQQYFDEIEAAISKVYNKPHYVGLCLFSYGNTGQAFTENDWSTFDVSTARDLQNALVNMSTPPITPPPFDYGDLSLYQLNITDADINAINLRAMPAVDSAALTTIVDGSSLRVSANSNTLHNYTWRQCIDVASGKSGFIAMTGKFELQPIVTPEPPPQLATVIVRIKGLTVEAAKELVNNVEITIE